MRGLTKEQRKAQLFKNGITAEDLEKEFKAGYESGFHDAFPAVMKTLYAAIVLALRHDPKLRFGRKRCKRVLCAVDDLVIEHLTSQEIIDAVFEEIGLVLNFQEPFDRVQEVDDGKRH